MSPTLYIFSGLPATGKSTLAKLLARETAAAYLRIDTIEQGLRDLLDCKVEGEGYRLSYRIAADNLLLGNSVVADSCNPIGLTRDEWNAVARENGARCVNIEVICSNKTLHRQRAESRPGEVKGLSLPTWQAIEERCYHPWDEPRIVIDTATDTVEESFALLLQQLSAQA